MSDREPTSTPGGRYHGADYPLSVERPDDDAAQQARAREVTLAKPAGALGRLESLSAWACAVQGRAPADPFDNVRVVVFAGDHGVAARGVSAYPIDVTAQMVSAMNDGGAAVNVIARQHDASVRVLDIAVAGDTVSTDPDYKVCRGSGSIEREDALSAEEVRRALSVGRSVADEEVDSGADLLIPGDMGIGNTTPATVVVAAVTGAEPSHAVGRGTGIDDAAWMRKTAAVRDALHRASGRDEDPLMLLQTVGGADLAAMAGFLAQAAVRRTPVLLDGVFSGAAAVLAVMLAPGAQRWWQAGPRSTEPAHRLALRHLDLDPLLDLDMRLGEGTGALVTLPLLQSAILTLAEMATFGEAGVSERA